MVTEADWADLRAAAHSLGLKQEELWNKVFRVKQKDFYATIELNDTEKTVVGFCEARNMRTPFPVIHVFIFEDCRELGIGFEAIRAFMEVVKKRKTNSVQGFCVGVSNENIAAKRLIKKLGGIADTDEDTQDWQLYFIPPC